MYRDLSNEQARQSIDAEQVFAAYRAAAREMATRFDGTTNWRTVGETDYLYRIKGSVAKSLGPRSTETEAIHTAFHDGKARAADTLARLSARLNAMAPVNQALQLGRMPTTPARILRELGARRLLGQSLVVVGTNALLCYERLCAVQIGSDLLATGDVDLLLDARRNLKLASFDLGERGLVGLLRRLDASFDLTGKGSFRAVNADGFMVDLITPTPRHRLARQARRSLSEAENDITAVEIEGLAWLVNAPKLTQTIIDERGFPLDITCPDPRAFALHKLWLSRRPDRNPSQRGRDAAQAALVATLLQTRVPSLSFSDDAALSALPRALRDLHDDLAAAAPPPPADTAPRW